MHIKVKYKGTSVCVKRKEKKVNIFYLSEDPTISAKAQPDKMLVKMILESAQMLSTAHRILDGWEIRKPSKSGKTMVKAWVLPDEREDVLYQVCHINHPCSVWVRECSGNYWWLYKHFLALGKEYTYRYKRTHRTVKDLADALYLMPKRITRGLMTDVAQAMPDEYKNEDSVLAYRNYVINEKHYAKWEKGRNKPSWWEANQ